MVELSKLTYEYYFNFTKYFACNQYKLLRKKSTKYLFLFYEDWIEYSSGLRHGTGLNKTIIQSKRICYIITRPSIMLIVNEI